jgi:hypothetical protein
MNYFYIDNLFLKSFLSILIDLFKSFLLYYLVIDKFQINQTLVVIFYTIYTIWALIVLILAFIVTLKRKNYTINSNGQIVAK